jgi:hypothetical protein
MKEKLPSKKKKKGYPKIKLDKKKPYIEEPDGDIEYPVLIESLNPSNSIKVKQGYSKI